MKIYMDTREPDKYRVWLREMGFLVEKVKLEQGDYMCANCIIERKEAADFVSSLVDGRLFEQAFALCTQEKIAFVVVHGEMQFDRVTKENIIGAIASLAVRHELPTIWIPDEWMAIYTIGKMLEKMNEGKYALPRLLPAKKAEMRKVGILAAILRISPSKAKALLETFGSIRRVVNASERELYLVQGIGEATARRIKAILGD